MTRTRLTLILTLLLAVTAGAFAQETPAATETAKTKTTATERTSTAAETESATAATTDPAPATAAEKSEAEVGTNSSYELRGEFGQLLHRLPPEVGTVLATDPMLLSNESYLAAYPQLSKFVAEHPEVQRSPRFYLEDFQERPQERHVFDKLLENVTIFATIGLISFALAWLVRTIIEQRRWSRLSRIQTEVHNKILDRFSTSEELLTYVRSPAGSKFLESAPIPVATAQPTRLAPAGPINRILWSFQIGAGVAVGAAGLLLLSLRFDADTAEGIFGMGAIAFCVGAGFIASAVVSLVLSRKLGLTNGPDVPANPLDDSGVVR